MSRYRTIRTIDFVVEQGNGWKESAEYQAFPFSIQNAILSLWRDNGWPQRMIVTIERWFDGGLGPGYAHFRASLKEIAITNIFGMNMNETPSPVKTIVVEEFPTTKRKQSFAQFRKKMMALALQEAQCQ